jgi:hypothetical protein
MGDGNELGPVERLRLFLPGVSGFIQYAGIFTPHALTGHLPLRFMPPDEIGEAERLALHEAKTAARCWEALGYDRGEWERSGFSPLRTALPGMFAFWPNFAQILDSWGFNVGIAEGSGRVFAEPPSYERPPIPLVVGPGQYHAMTAGWGAMNGAVAGLAGSFGPLRATITKDGRYVPFKLMPVVSVEFCPPAVVIDGARHAIEGGATTAKRAALYIDALLQAGEKGTTYEGAKATHGELEGENVTNIWKCVPDAIKDLCENVTGRRINARTGGTNSL